MKTEEEKKSNLKFQISSFRLKPFGSIEMLIFPLTLSFLSFIFTQFV